MWHIIAQSCMVRSLIAAHIVYVGEDGWSEGWGPVTAGHLGGQWGP